MDSYGNPGWEIFVYLTYFIVGISILIFAFLSGYSRKKYIQEMKDEGLFQDKKDE